jgi:hypothetical protein
VLYLVLEKERCRVMACSEGCGTWWYWLRDAVPGLDAEVKGEGLLEGLVLGVLHIQYIRFIKYSRPIREDTKE